MNMVVKRNLYPVIPILAVVLGVGIAEWGGRLFALGAAGVRVARWPWRPGWHWLACGLRQTRRVPPGGVLCQPRARGRRLWCGNSRQTCAGLLDPQESYTPDFAEGEYEITHLPSPGRLAPRISGKFQYVLLASSAFERFLDAESLRRPHPAGDCQELRRDLPHLRAGQAVEPPETQLGPELRFYGPR